jgi:isopentenyl-diphosphate Delta-isomerase
MEIEYYTLLFPGIYMRGKREAGKRRLFASRGRERPEKGQSMELVVLVNENDAAVGEGEKREVHRDGSLHRCFSVMIADSSGKIFLQKRARGKYHSGGLWSNACCGHPRPGEEVDGAAHRRLREELGFDCPLARSGSAMYRLDLGAEMIEHEYNHFFVGLYDGPVSPDPLEVEDWALRAPEAIAFDLRSHPESYSAWFPIVFAGSCASLSALFPRGDHVVQNSAASIA